MDTTCHTHEHVLGTLDDATIDFEEVGTLEDMGGHGGCVG